jgi:alkylation response protein AidB-like acyl-CoA dehydrogenase
MRILSVINHLSILNLPLQDCLAEGRSVSLPASAVGASKLAVTAVGAYARIRKQFRVPIAEMGGVQVTILNSITAPQRDRSTLGPYT